MRAVELERLAEEIGIDVVGASRAEPYEETEGHIRERRARGLFADMRFTMTQPEVSCHPEALLPGARTVISTALCYYVPGPRGLSGNPRDAGARENRALARTQGASICRHIGATEDTASGRFAAASGARGLSGQAPEAGPDEGRLPRYTWRSNYVELREKLDALGRRLGGSYRVLVDENQHVDREGAARAGVGFYGKNTMLITRRYGSWVVLGTLVTDVEVEPAPRLELDCGSCTLCIEACPTGALDEPGVLDSTKCLSYWTQAPGSIPEEYRADLGDQVYGCDICQDVCPWNRGVEKRRAGEALPRDAEPTVSLADWLAASNAALRTRYERLYFPKKDPRFLRRNALVAAGNSGEPALVEAVAPFLRDPDSLLAEHAEWALAQIAKAPV